MNILIVEQKHTTSAVQLLFLVVFCELFNGVGTYTLVGEGCGKQQVWESEGDRAWSRVLGPPLKKLDNGNNYCYSGGCCHLMLGQPLNSKIVAPSLFLLWGEGAEEKRLMR